MHITLSLRMHSSMYCFFPIAIVPHVATLLSDELKDAGLVDGRGGLMFQLLDRASTCWYIIIQEVCYIH